MWPPGRGHFWPQGCNLKKKTADIFSIQTVELYKPYYIQNNQISTYSEFMSFAISFHYTMVLWPCTDPDVGGGGGTGLGGGTGG